MKHAEFFSFSTGKKNRQRKHHLLLVFFLVTASPASSIYCIAQFIAPDIIQPTGGDFALEMPVVRSGVDDGNILNDLLLQRTRKLQFRRSALRVHRRLNLDQIVRVVFVVVNVVFVVVVVVVVVVIVVVVVVVVVVLRLLSLMMLLMRLVML